ncbi:acyl-CoA synthetase [Halalkalicoccus jeotgali B3]|uniref:Acyl-CoA synthetase n=1 Tax=Halalkalicoccus jeotgali (strain DSM 18796 / CECT 7217 / JCM 14584 / KCTC 4019 / B3) TaxID=795797 RepID=D8J5L1_HALJB|nr:acyl-CoA synthetase [Halalkalicoccus jeotgali B3]
MADFEWDVPEEYNLPAVIESHGESFGDRVALEFRNEAGDRTERTYGDLRGDMNRFANALAERRIGKGDRVLLLLPRHPDVFAIQLGVLKRGALVVPCSSMLAPKDIEYRATDCEATGIVCDASLLEMVEPVLEETPLETLVALDGDTSGDLDGGATFDAFEGDWASFTDLVAAEEGHHDGPALGAADPMSINYTSGTTGQPKPVLHRHRWMRCFELVNGPYWWGITAEDDLEDELLWATTGTGWAKWFWSPVGVGLTTGARQFVYGGAFDPERFLELLEEEGVTRLCAVPTQYRMFSQTDLGAYDPALREAVSAGEPLNRDPIAAFEEAFGVTPRDGYGQTETVALVTNYPGIEVKPGSMGKPAPGMGTTIIDPDEEREVEPGEIGEIAVPVDCPGIFDGYFERPDLDERTFAGEYYRTGDLASRDEEGYFFFEGRADDIIISAGYRIGPFEVEDALIEHEAVTEAAAVASPHDERGNVVKAYVVLADGYEGNEDLTEEIQAVVKSETAPYKYPRRIEYVTELPKTSSGKIRRIELRKRERA